MALPSILDAAHHFAARGLETGDLAIDATVGNGHDTLFLLRAVGEGGRVVGFDVQAAALDATRERIQTNAPSAFDRLRLVQAGHESMADHLETRDRRAVGAVMFNLGYLPGGDHSVTTNPDTTVQALDTGADLLRPGGVLTIVGYTGHEGGREEVAAVEAWAASLPQEAFQSLSYQFVNQANDPPRLYAVEKRDATV